MTKDQLTIAEIQTIGARDSDFFCQVGGELALDLIHRNVNNVEPPIVADLEQLLADPRVVQLAGFAAVLGARMADEAKGIIEGSPSMGNHFTVNQVVDAATDVAHRQGAHRG